MKTIDSKILTLLSLVQMWKFFSHFGVRILLTHLTQNAKRVKKTCKDRLLEVQLLFKL